MTDDDTNPYRVETTPQGLKASLRSWSEHLVKKRRAAEAAASEAKPGEGLNPNC